MSSAEDVRLRNAKKLLTQAVDDLPDEVAPFERQLLVLEHVASGHAGWSHDAYREAADLPAVSSTVGGRARAWADKLACEMDESDIPTPLALAALSREPRERADQRKTGAYYTDWRLAQQLAASAVPLASRESLWVDPACGSGILLAAAVLASSKDANERTRVICDLLCGSDLSVGALRGALLAVASLTPSLEAISAFRGRLLRQDSLTSAVTWSKLAPEGFSLVIGNPPWEKLKVTKHEVASEAGASRHYGSPFDAEPWVEHVAQRRRGELLRYVAEVSEGTRLQGSGEHDLYKLFLELGLGLVAADGVLALLLPAGLIRSEGTEGLRRELFRASARVSIDVMENRRKHFDIDSRFKYLAVVAEMGSPRDTVVSLRVANREGALPDRPVALHVPHLAELRPDLSLPEVRSEAEWDLFVKLCSSGTRVGDTDGPWRPRFVREIDMTNDRSKFLTTKGGGAVPVIEGRHVQQFRYRAKQYVSGRGRAAKWASSSVESAQLVPQWWVSPAMLRGEIGERVSRSRVGFCDIVGQTNERTLMAARVPAGVACGNKVPTVDLAQAGPEWEDLFLALVNSLTVDWLLRRQVTTTLNFFIFNQLCLPEVTPFEGVGRRLVALARRATVAEGATAVDLWKLGLVRAELDALVAVSWGLGLAEMETVFTDFPLLDRGQPGVLGEVTSTVTRDVVLWQLARLMGEDSGQWRGRADRARRAGAVPYLPAEQVQEEVDVGGERRSGSAPV